MSLQACSNVSLEDIALLGECCPSDRDSSLNLIVVVVVSGAVFLSQVDVAFNVFNRSVVDIYWGVVLCRVYIIDIIYTYIFYILYIYLYIQYVYNIYI